MGGDTDNPHSPGDAKAKIRRLNDHLRTSGAGGRIVMTAGIDQLSIVAIALILSAVAQFDDFNADNDPHGEHDCASLCVAGHDVIWKIDYYDLDLQYHSPNPADPKVTRPRDDDHAGGRILGRELTIAPAVGRAESAL
jgi:hypothetical protein